MVVTGRQSEYSAQVRDAREGNTQVFTWGGTARETSPPDPSPTSLGSQNAH